MEQLTAIATKRLLDWVTSGLPGALAANSDSAPTLNGGQFLPQQIKPDVVEKSMTVVYPLVLVYCTRAENRQLEKFRSFSGSLSLVVELKSSSPQIAGLSDELQLLVDSTVSVLQQARGDWGDGLLYGGRYEVVFGPIRQGGRGFVQDAKVALEVSGSVG